MGEIWHVYCMTCGHVTDGAVSYEKGKILLDGHKAKNPGHVASLRPMR